MDYPQLKFQNLNLLVLRQRNENLKEKKVLTEK